MPSWLFRLPYQEHRKRRVRFRQNGHGDRSARNHEGHQPTWAEAEGCVAPSNSFRCCSSSWWDGHGYKLSGFAQFHSLRSYVGQSIGREEFGRLFAWNVSRQRHVCVEELKVTVYPGRLLGTIVFCGASVSIACVKLCDSCDNMSVGSGVGEWNDDQSQLLSRVSSSSALILLKAR